MEIWTNNFVTFNRQGRVEDEKLWYFWSSLKNLIFMGGWGEGGWARTWKTGIEEEIAWAWIVSRFMGCAWQEQEGGDCVWGVGWYLNDTIPISFCLWCLKISCLLYIPGYMLLCTHNGLHSRKAIVIEKVLWCVSFILF